MHKIWIHGPILIEKVIPPIIQLPEEATEANKHFRQSLAQNAWKISCGSQYSAFVFRFSSELQLETKFSVNWNECRDKKKKKSKSFLNETAEILLPIESSEARDKDDSD